MPKGGSKYRTSRPCKSNRYYENKDYYDKRDANSKGKSSTISHTNTYTPLENPEMFLTVLRCHKCENKFEMSLTAYNELTRNAGYFDIEKRTRKQMCPKCYNIYVQQQNKLKVMGLLTDVEVEKLANKTTEHPYGWEYTLGFIYGFIKMRDNKKT